jgi:O-antigen/teichoic acid export membrane protein
MLATLGTVMVAGVHFLASLVVLHGFSKADFGIFAFMFTISQFTLGLSNAMICAPFSVNVSQVNHTVDEETPYFQTNLLFSISVACASFFIGMFVAPWQTSLAFSIWICLATIRWFMRNFCFAKERPVDVFISDLIYSAAFFAGLIFIFLNPDALWVAGAVAAAAAFAGILANGAFVRQQISSAGISHINQYLPVWKEQARWALLGVTSTEATSNAHSWLVSIWAGPAAFAPIAAAGLFFRPLALVANALTQVERPALAQLMAKGKHAEADARLKHFRYILLAAWGFSIGLIGFCAVFFSSKLIKPGYDAQQLGVALLLLASIAIVTCWRLPESLAIQVQGKFKALSMASVYSGIITVVATAILIKFLGAVYSLIAILLGQFVLALLLNKLFRSSWKQHA